ncbi:MAG: DUF4433 domain-containing protein, partial [Cryobacterium sp.]|nr:DUF4433 domain-containing protein [Cryobacterium sp.]
GPTASIGMGTIKQRRLALSVKCHGGDHVGEYVPFYFGPRSVMLFLIYRANHSELAYRGGQDPIVHLEADFNEAVAWAEENSRRWAFTLSNAGGAYAEFRADVRQLHEVNWDAVAATDFRNPDIKEGKQAEFLVQDFFPWKLIRRIGVSSLMVHSRVVRAMADANHRPPVEVLPNWYY